MWSTLILLFYIFLVFLFISSCCGLVLDLSITFFLHHQLSPQNFLELMDGSWSDGKRIMNYKEEDEYEEEEEEEESEIGYEEDDKKKRVVRNHSKRGFKAGSSVPPCCQVDGCSADLSDAKAYHKRHKVCEYHAKAPAVLIGDQHQRFCQQCSRFHELSEFDDSKRSCRRRLAGHNERRRKNASEYHGL